MSFIRARASVESIGQARGLQAIQNPLVCMRCALVAAARVSCRSRGVFVTPQVSTSSFSIGPIDDKNEFGHPTSHHQWTDTWRGGVNGTAVYTQRVVHGTSAGCIGTREHSTLTSGFAVPISNGILSNGFDNENDTKIKDKMPYSYAAVRTYGTTNSTNSTTNSTAIPTTQPSIQPWSKEDILTVPNYISIARGVFGPILGVAYVADLVTPETVFAGVVAAGISDWLDGFIARRLKLKSVAGTYLDPLGDKFFVTSMAVAFTAKGFVPMWLGGMLVIRDVSLIAGSWIQRGRALGWRWDTWGQFFAGTKDVTFGDHAGGYGGGGDSGFGQQTKQVEESKEFDGLHESDSNSSKKDAPAIPPMKPELIGKISTCVQFALFGTALCGEIDAFQGSVSTSFSHTEVMEFLFLATGGTTVLSSAQYFFRKDAFARVRDDKL